MKFTLELPIQSSRADVWKAFDNPENMKEWQPTLVKFELMSGVAGQPGAVSRLTYSEGSREFSLIEKVTQRIESERLEGVYENEFADNIIRNVFVATSENATLWKMETEFKFKTLLMKMIGPLMKKRFVTRTQKDMERFKKLVEDR